MSPVPRALTIAGSDSGGCAGIQADLKTFAALGVHGMSVITAVTAQDTCRVHNVVDLPLENIECQFRAVVEDIGVDAAKTGMLASTEIIELVAGKVEEFKIRRLVVDPVMLSGGGDPLIRPEAVESLKNRLFPRACLVTPNRWEAERLIGRTIETEADLEKALEEIFELGPAAVLIKGGHGKDPRRCIDYFFEGRKPLPLIAERIPTQNTHGSGCTLAAAVTALLARGRELEEAVRLAKEYVTEAIRHSLSLGHGQGPLGHFWRYWTDS